MKMKIDTASVIFLGKTQIDNIFDHQRKVTLDDSEFIPFLEVVLNSFESIKLNPAAMDELWNHAYSVYDQLCRRADPSCSFEENRDLMRKYLLGSRRINSKRKKS